MTTTQMANQIRMARKRKNVTQKELAKLTGLPQSYISQIENGQYAPNLTNLAIILDALDHKLVVAEKSKLAKPYDFMLS